MRMVKIPGLMAPSRALGFNEYGITEAEAKRLCGGTLPAPGRERLVEAYDEHFWVRRVNFTHDSNYHPVTWPWLAKQTAWRLVNGRAELHYDWIMDAGCSKPHKALLEVDDVVNTAPAHHWAN